jgi:hypothetical protein
MSSGDSFLPRSSTTPVVDTSMARHSDVKTSSFAFTRTSVRTR